MSAPYLHDLALDLLLVAEAALDPICNGHELPPRRYVHFGEPAWDLCQGDTSPDMSGQLVAWPAGITNEVIERGGTCAIRHVGRLCVEVARCFPSLQEDGQPATADALMDAAEVVNRDWWSLLRGVTAWVAGLDCRYKEIMPSEPSGPAGGMAGVRICVRLELNDTEPCEEGS